MRTTPPRSRPPGPVPGRPLCDPEYRGAGQANGGHLTGAPDDAPHAGLRGPARSTTPVRNACTAHGAPAGPAALPCGGTGTTTPLPPP